MRAWHFVLVLYLALMIGLGAGYVYWGRKAEQLALELTAAKKPPPRPEREWANVPGVVRGIMPEIGVMVLSHGEMPGYMRPMTMGFKVASPELYRDLEVGDEVRFTVRGNPPRVAIVAIEKAG